MQIPQTVLIGLVVAVVGYFLQQRSWRNSKREEIRQKEFEEAVKLVDDLARAIDKRLAHLVEFLSNVDRETASADGYNVYKNSVRDWMLDFSSFKSRIFHFFGRGTVYQFENSVHASLRSASDIVLRTHKYGQKKLSSRHQEEFATVRFQIDLARVEAFSFLRELNERISTEDIGRSRLYDNVEIGKLDLISRLYLLQRLLGLKS